MRVVVEKMALSDEPKRKRLSGGRKFLNSWRLPNLYIAIRESMFAFWKLCNSHFSIAHGELFDITHYMKGITHIQRLRIATKAKDSNKG